MRAEIIIKGQNQQVIVLNQETADLVTKTICAAEAVKDITSIEQFKAADDLCAVLRRQEKEIQEHRESLTKPIEAFKKQIIAAADVVVKDLARARLHVGNKVLAYQQEEERKATELRRKQDEERRQAEEAERKRQIEVQASLAKDDFPEIAVLSPVSPVVHTPVAPVVKSHSSTTVTNRELRIDNELLIPREFLVPNEVAIRKALMEGMKIAGCRLEEVTKVRAK